MRIALTSMLLALTACGNWSNEDIEYLYALPQRDVLKSKLTSMGNTTQMPLLAGDPSKVYDDTSKQSDEFNAFIDGVLTGLDGVRMYPPTRREENGRWWGPFPDSKNPGFDVMVEIHRLEDMTYTWAIKMRPRLGTFVTLGGGTYKPTTSETLRKGQGTFFFDGKAGRELLDGGMPGDPDRADFGYATDVDPVVVTIDLKLPDAKRLAYGYNGYADKSAVLSYLVSDPLNLNTSKVSFDVYWNSSTAGRADFKILEGYWATAKGAECWDESHVVVYGEGYDDAGHYVVGDETKCVQRLELMPLP